MIRIELVFNQCDIDFGIFTGLYINSSAVLLIPGMTGNDEILIRRIDFDYLKEAVRTGKRRSHTCAQTIPSQALM